MAEPDLCRNCGAPRSAHWGVEGAQCPRGGLVCDLDTGEVIVDLGPLGGWFDPA